MNTLIQREANHIPWVNGGSAVAVNAVVGPIGTGLRFGVAVNAIGAGETGILCVEGVHQLAAASADAWAEGDILYWDVADGNLTDDADSGTNKQIGVAVGAKIATVTTAKVLLNK